VAQASGFPDGMLLERADQLATLGAALARIVGGAGGGVVLVPGEAGIGKTSLLRQFCASIGTSARVLRSACDPLFTPRPLGPLVELAEDIRSALVTEISTGADAFDVAGVLLRELKVMAPAVVVIEDMHWADEATLDVVRLLARRLESAPVLLVLSYRDDQLDRTQPLRVVVGELSGAGRVLTRLQLTGLSTAAVAALAGRTGLDPAELHDRTAGNPFFVTEVIGAGAGSTPLSVRDAVLARAARLSEPARNLLDVAAVVPGEAESWLLASVDSAAMDGLDECVGSGMVTASDGRVRFRHEIARLVIEQSLAPSRRTALNGRVLSVLEKEEDDRVGDPARLAHHAEAAGDGAAVLRYAPDAARMASAVGAHREAARLYSVALAYADRLTGPERADLLECYAEEGNFTAVGQESTTAIREALKIHRDRGDVHAEGRALRLLASCLGREGRLAESLAANLEAVAVLEQIPPTAELALSYVSMAAIYGIGLDAQARDWGLKAIRLGGELGCAKAVYGGLNIVGCIKIVNGDVGGVADLERSRELAEQHGDYLEVGRAYMHLCWMLAMSREWQVAERYLGSAITFCRDHGQELWFEQLRCLQMEAHLARGRWKKAAAEAEAVLATGDRAPAVSRADALIVLGTLRARRGQPGGWRLLNDARELVSRLGYLHLYAPVASARAEAAWLEGRQAVVLEEAELANPTAPGLDPFTVHELSYWRWRAGVAAGDPVTLREPYRTLASGDRSTAARWWQDRGQPYQAALVWVGSGDAESLRDSLEVLRDLGARPAMAIVARELRELGEVDLPRQSSAPIAAYPSGLTAREVDVLRLLVTGLRNSEIAAQLVLSPRTVDHHVSALMRKLGVQSRGGAIAAGVRLGLVEP
jgi:DNA-binding CsgD family transcriptional regulator/tetratricopeptide (TPR) repeat protein